MAAIAYYDDTNSILKFSRFGNFSLWTDDVATDGAGLYASLAYSRTGLPTIAYLATTNRCLEVASFNGTAWQTTIIDISQSAGWYASLAFSPSGQPAIAYYDGFNRDLKFAQRALFTGK